MICFSVCQHEADMLTASAGGSHDFFVAWQSQEPFRKVRAILAVVHACSLELSLLLESLDLFISRTADSDHGQDE